MNDKKKFLKISIFLIIIGAILIVVIVFININNYRYPETLPDSKPTDSFEPLELRWLTNNDFNVQKIDGTGPKSTKGPHADWIYAEDPYDKLYIIDLGFYGDIEKIQIEWVDNKTRNYRIDAATDSRSWYHITYNEPIETLIHEYEILETYRRYLRIVLKGSNSSLEDIHEVKVLSAPSRPAPEPPLGPKTLEYPQPVIVPLPVNVKGINQPVKTLSGSWKFTANPPPLFWRNDTDFSDWGDILVPGCSDAQGFGVKSRENLIEWHYPRKNVETVYKHKIYIPKEYDGNKIILRFEAAYSYARIWINGEMVRIHRSGFTTFDTDITDYVIPGMDAIMTVGLTAEVNTPEFPLPRGLLGDVKLIALPSQHITRLHVETTFDDSYINATLKVMGGLNLPDGVANGQIKLTLTDAAGEEVKIEPSHIDFSEKIQQNEVLIFVRNPHKWNAEDPYLYNLEAVIEEDGKVIQRVIRRVGFRDVKREKVTKRFLFFWTREIEGNNLLVNGEQIKLRGVNWTNISPVSGLSANPDYDRESLLKLKAANINYIRTAHFPQYDYFYDLADELGFYVEAEASVHLLTRYIQTHFERYEIKDDPGYTDWYLAQYAEMVEKDRSHPSIIFWSIGNESDWGYNFKQARDYVMSVDITRPVKFSWDTYVPKREKTDIRSIHYPTNDTYMQSVDRPTIYDEYAHLYTNNSRIEKDPALRDIYGYKIQRHWEGAYNQQGAMGGAIWHSRDFFIYGPNGIWSFNPKWGLLDTWNREKPEYYHVKKAYSPVKIKEDRIYQNPGAGKELILPVENRYNHINLNELIIEWNVGEEYGVLKGPDIKPLSKGDIAIPARNWSDGDRLYLKFIRPNDAIKDFVVDEYEFVIGGEKVTLFPGPSGAAPNIQENEEQIKISGERFEIIFSKDTGKIISGLHNGQTIIIDGPDINLGIDTIPSGWVLKSLSTKQEGIESIVTIAGRYRLFDNVNFEIRIDGTGRMEIGYGMNLPDAQFDELGVSFKLVTDIDRIRWKRKANLWTVYPEDHIGRLSGTAYRYRGEGEEIYAVKPEWSWSLDEKEFAFGITPDNWQGTRDFRASKHNFYHANVLTKKGYGIRAESDGKGSVRVTPQEDGSVKFDINSEWGSTAINEFKRYDIPLSVTSGYYSGKVVLRLIEEN